MTDRLRYSFGSGERRGICGTFIEKADDFGEGVFEPGDDPENQPPPKKAAKERSSGEASELRS